MLRLWVVWRENICRDLRLVLGVFTSDPVGRAHGIEGVLRAVATNLVGLSFISIYLFPRDLFWLSQWDRYCSGPGIFDPAYAYIGGCLLPAGPEWAHIWAFSTISSSSIIGRWQTIWAVSPVLGGQQF